MAANQVININSTQPLGGPNQGIGTDQGDTWDVAAAKLNNWVSAGGSGVTVGTNGMIFKQAATVNSGNTNTTQTLGSFTVPANTFNAAGQELQVTAWGVTANNAAPKSVALN